MEPQTASPGRCRRKHVHTQGFVPAGTGWSQRETTDSHPRWCPEPCPEEGGPCLHTRPFPSKELQPSHLRESPLWGQQAGEPPQATLRPLMGGSGCFPSHPHKGGRGASLPILTAAAMHPAHSSRGGHSERARPSSAFPPTKNKDAMAEPTKKAPEERVLGPLNTALKFRTSPTAAAGLRG